MIELYWGENTYLHIKKRKVITKQALACKAEIFNFDFSKDFDFNYLKGVLAGGGLFASKKIIVLNNLLTKQKQRPLSRTKEIVDFIEAAGKKDELKVYVFEEKPDSKDKLFNKLKRKATKVEKFQILKGKELEVFLEKETREMGVKIEKAQLLSLCLAFNYDLWLVINEIKKIASYKNYKEITGQDVATFINPQVTKDIFKTIDALARRDKKTALFLVHQHLKDKDDPFYLFSMFVYQFRNLLKVKDASQQGVEAYQIAKESKLHPFVVRKCLDFTSRLELGRLRALYKKLAEIDYSLKRGRLQIDSALDLFIAFS